METTTMSGTGTTGNGTTNGAHKTLSPTFTSVQTTDTQQKAIQDIRTAFNDLLEKVTIHTTNGRYLSLVTTKLEEACMFAVKGITHTN